MSRTIASSFPAVLYHPSFNQGQGAFTYAAWFYVTGNSASQLIMGQWGSGNGARAILYLASTKMQGAILGSDLAGQGVSAGATTVTANAWHHGALTFEPSVAIRLYLDGVQDSVLTSSVKGAISNGSPPGNNFRMGNDFNANNRLDGQVDQACLWTAVLSAAEVLALSKGVRPSMVRPSSRQLDWPIMTAIPLLDISGNALPPSDSNSSAATSQPPAGRIRR